MGKWLSVAGMSPSQVPTFDARLRKEGYDEARVLAATDVQLSLLLRNATFASRLTNCLSKYGCDIHPRDNYRLEHSAFLKSWLTHLLTCLLARPGNTWKHGDQLDCGSWTPD